MSRLVNLVLIFVVAGAVYAQKAGESVGVIVYAEGEELTIIRAGRLLRLDAGSGEAFGEPIFAGDQVSTDDASYAEIQLLASRTIVRVSENTTFRVAAMTGSGESSLELAYGRLRSRVQQLAGTQSFEIRGFSAVAGVRGTDFTFEQLLDPDTGTVIEQVSTFDGEVIVEKPDANELTIVASGEMATVRAAQDGPALVVAPVATSVVSYWETRSFVREYREPEEILEEFPGLREKIEEQDLVTVAQSGPAEAVEVAGEADTEVSPANEESEAVLGSDTIAKSAEDNVDEDRGDEGSGPALAEEVSEPEETLLAEPVTRGDSAETDVAPAVEETSADDDSGNPRVGRVFRTTGVVLTAVGIATDLVAVGLYYAGDAVFSGWSSSQTDLMGPVAGVGLGVLAGGLLLILVGNAL